MKTDNLSSLNTMKKSERLHRSESYFAAVGLLSIM